MKNKNTHKILLSLIISLGISTNLYSSETIRPAIFNEANNKLMAETSTAFSKGTATVGGDCADPELEGSLAHRQQEVLDEQKRLATTTIDLPKYFEVGKKGGCFSALSNFPDLSLSIPSLTDIFSKLQQTLVTYATRKACNAVNNTIEKALGPLQEKLEDLSSSGQLDMSGRLNKELMKKYYDIDPELGRVSTKADPSYTFNW
ncbi:hypothetical protein A7M79_00130 [Acinetobacter baumannii]|uniref:hypothetical protein n=1 Tax=Acinetobacter baumannii TaxID=470 RepID=UPI0008DCDDE3|nr:hypothetical protein [Acinetobacter baumannii]OIH11930.1 hypothetical protein A7M79_00130 [Acinetobacter baumannii]